MKQIIPTQQIIPNTQDIKLLVPLGIGFIDGVKQSTIIAWYINIDKDGLLRKIPITDDDNPYSEMWVEAFGGQPLQNQYAFLRSDGMVVDLNGDSYADIDAYINYLNKGVKGDGKSS